MTSALINLLLDEFFGWFPWLAAWLIRRASRQLPKDVRVRYEDEWLAELDALPSRGLSSLFFALRILVGVPGVRRVIAGVAATSRVSFAVKRSVDLFISVFTLWSMIPIFSIAALAVKLSGRGPVLARSRRIDQGGKAFFLLSFRTAVPITVSSGQSLRPITGVRITRVGRFLDRSGVDALPMLINVVKGEMSLVGPCARTPGRAFDAARDIPAYNALQPVKPGITGLAQLGGLRGATLADQIALDNHYVHHRSFVMDLNIIARTFVSAFRAPEVDGQRQ